MSRNPEPDFPTFVCPTCSLLPGPRFSQNDCRVAVCPKTTVEVRNRAELFAAVNRRPGGPGWNKGSAWRHASPHLPCVASSEQGPEQIASAASEYPGRPKLTPELAAEIRAAYQAGGVTQAELAVRFGISSGAISAVVTGRTWRSAPETKAA